MNRKPNHWRVITKLALRNILRNYKSGLLTMAVIATGVVSVSLLDGFIRNVESELENGYIHRAMLGHVEIYHQGKLEHPGEDQWKYTLTPEEQKFVEEVIQKDSSVKTRVRFLEISGLITNGDQTTLFNGAAYDVEEGVVARGLEWEWNAFAGAPLHSAPVKPSLLLGKELGKFLGCNFSSETEIGHRSLTCPHPTHQLSVLTEHGQVNLSDLPTAGLIDTGIQAVDEHYLNLPLESAQALFATQNLTYVSILLQKAEDGPSFISKFNRLAQAAHLEIEAVSWRKDPSAESLEQGVKLLRVFKLIFLSVAICVALMAVLNLMTKSIAERIREVGTLKALGFLQKDLASLFAWEGFYLALTGATIGLLLTAICAGILPLLHLSYRGGVLTTPLPVRVTWTPLDWCIDIFFFVLLCTFTTFFAGRKAAKLSPAEALSSVER